jgi:flagellar protein FlbD
MIIVTKLNDKEFMLNCEAILAVESNPDTLITTIQGQKFIVKESVDDILAKVIQYKRKIHFFPAAQQTAKKQ